jgi:hypothetical protein
LYVEQPGQQRIDLTGQTTKRPTTPGQTTKQPTTPGQTTKQPANTARRATGQTPDQPTNDATVGTATKKPSEKVPSPWGSDSRGREAPATTDRVHHSLLD